MELFTEIINKFHPLKKKKKSSILDVWLSSEYAPGL